MRLVSSGRVRQEVFVDTDNLQNLTSLFNTVAHETGTLVVVASHEIFTRPWCIGEMCTAKANNIPTIVVGMPDYSEPSDELIDKLGEVVSDLDSVYRDTSGMTLTNLQETLRWVRSLPRIDMPKGALSLENVDDLVHHLVCGKTSGRLLSAYEPVKPGCPLFIAANRNNTEAVAAGLVLQAMLLPHLIEAGRLCPHMLQTKEKLPKSARVVMVLCSNGLMADPDMLEQLLDAKRQNAWLLPVVCEEAFRFPGADSQVLTQLKGVHPASSEERLREIMESLRVMFQEIAVTFIPQVSADSVLQAEVQDIARRVSSRRDISGRATAKDLSISQTMSTTSDGAESRGVEAWWNPQQLRLQWHDFSISRLLSRSGSRFRETPSGAAIDIDTLPHRDTMAYRNHRRLPRQSLSQSKRNREAPKPHPANGQFHPANGQLVSHPADLTKAPQLHESKIEAPHTSESASCEGPPPRKSLIDGSWACDDESESHNTLLSQVSVEKGLITL